MHGHIVHTSRVAKKAVPMAGEGQSNRPHVGQKLLFSSFRSSACFDISSSLLARSCQMSKPRAAQIAVRERQAADNPGMHVMET